MATKKFELDDDQVTKLNKWLKRHNKKCPDKFLDKQGAIGGRLSYHFTPTGVGTAAVVHCRCGKKVDLTPDDW